MPLCTFSAIDSGCNHLQNFFVFAKNSENLDNGENSENPDNGKNSENPVMAKILRTLIMVRSIQGGLLPYPKFTGVLSGINKV